MPKPYTARTYRNTIECPALQTFEVHAAESDLWIASDAMHADIARAALRACRAQISSRIRQQPEFQTSLEPLADDPAAAPIIRSMLAAGRTANVGPMAAVAGAIATAVGTALRQHANTVVVENGGDIYLHAPEPLIVGIFAGASPLSSKIGLRVGGNDQPTGVCTSSATVGPSLSLGAADAATVVSPNTALADAAATALGNRVRTAADIDPALQWVSRLPEIRGALIIINDAMGAWGALELVHL